MVELVDKGSLIIDQATRHSSMRQMTTPQATGTHSYICEWYIIMSKSQVEAYTGACRNAGDNCPANDQRVQSFLFKKKQHARQTTLQKSQTRSRGRHRP